jgi:hypothetical protein
MRSLKSSAIDAIDHDGEALIVRFTSGHEARYPSAGAEHVDAMHAADSPGQYFHEHIRGNHQSEADMAKKSKGKGKGRGC